MKTFKELYEACCAACEKRMETEEVKEPTGDLKKACWKGYTAIGMKMKNGRKVPNCVPTNEEVEQIDESNYKSHFKVRGQYKDKDGNYVGVTHKIKYVKDAGHAKRIASEKVGKQYKDYKVIRATPLSEEVDQIEEAKHRVNVTVSDPNHTAVSKRDETVQKFVRLSAADEKSAVEKAKAHYKSKGFKVHSADHVGMVGESTQKGKNVVPPHVGALVTGGIVKEATFQGKKVPLNKPMAGDVKKSKVYVDPDGDGTAQKVNFGDKNMTIKKHIPGRRKNFRARHNCDNPGPKTKARYWSCRAW